MHLSRAALFKPAGPCIVAINIVSATYESQQTFRSHLVNTNHFTIGSVVVAPVHFLNRK